MSMRNKKHIMSMIKIQNKMRYKVQLLQGLVESPKVVTDNFEVHYIINII